jgi:mannosyl-oligosaccharide alpha-1,2-mannosidase
VLFNYSIPSVLLAPKNKRQTAVRDAMEHAWKAYQTYAWGYDELQSISKTPSSWFGLGLTIVDAIDTLYIMNMTTGLMKYFLL